MIKFLKTLLFFVIMVFSFALGVKYSYLFSKGDLNILSETDIMLDNKRNLNVNNQEETHEIVIEEAPAELSPLTDEERNEIEELNADMPNFENIDETIGTEQTELENSEPMDGINSDELKNTTGTNDIENSNNKADINTDINSGVEQKSDSELNTQQQISNAISADSVSNQTTQSDTKNVIQIQQ